MGKRKLFSVSKVLKEWDGEIKMFLICISKIDLDASFKS